MNFGSGFDHCPVVRSKVRSRVSSVVVLLVACAVAGSALVGCQFGATPVAEAKEKDPALMRLGNLLARTDGHPSSAELADFEGSVRGTRAAALARFLRGYLAADSQDWSGAAAALDTTDIADKTAIGDYAMLYRGRALVQTGRAADAIGVLEQIRTRYPQSLLLHDATIEAARAALGTGDAARAEKLCQPLVEANDADALMIVAGIRQSAGDTPGEIDAFRRAYFLDPASPAAATAAAQLTTLGADPSQGEAMEAELRARATELFAAQRWQEASDAYGRLLVLYPALQDREQLNLMRGTAAGNARDAATAAVTLTLVSNRDPELQAQALYQLAMAYKRAIQYDQYEATGSRLKSLYPKSDWTGKFLGDYSDYLESKNRLAEQYQVQRALIEGFPKNEKAAEASYDLAWLSYKTSDYRHAAELFAEHLATFRTPQTKWVGEAAFWGGRAWERLGNVPRALFFYSLAAERYPFGYHGQIATRRTELLKQRDPNVRPEQPAAGSQLAKARENALAVQPIVETADERATPRLVRVTDFQTIALWDVAMSELAAAQALFPTSPRVALAAANLFQARGDNYQATLALRKGYPDVYSYSEDQMPREAWEVMFPLSNWDAIKHQAALNNLDPYVVCGLIRQESVFNPKALSRANARGLMQLLPSTGKLVAKSQGLGAISPADLYNPTLNITLGTSYLSTQLSKFGRIELAAAAYNAGPGRVVQWQAARPVEPIEEWVENIPLSETRGYVQGVLRYAANYRRFYGKGEQRAGDAK